MLSSFRLCMMSLGLLLFLSLVHVLLMLSSLCFIECSNQFLLCSSSFLFCFVFTSNFLFFYCNCMSSLLGFFLYFLLFSLFCLLFFLCYGSFFDLSFFLLLSSKLFGILLIKNLFFHYSSLFHLFFMLMCHFVLDFFLMVSSHSFCLKGFEKWLVFLFTFLLHLIFQEIV